ncbi:LacI family transcriptional regulator [Brachybacterium muris]|uniref:LacI family DNA-binding transcriptional regulator n=1 Tax=Brachybacterium muris TaxID=219301 RepID=UPI00223C3B1C|nr:LacI family DNA-binding transcriptional regulator [Brachybacterium muris]MCT2262153.1 LacI family transcriptional regulator [Brachybacterium muris]
MASRRPTIMDVARTAGVSSATVSRVINGAPTVDKELSRRVRTAVRTTGYVPNAMGRSLRRGGSAQIAVVAPDAENPYFSQITTEVERIARGQNHSVLIAHTEEDLEIERTCFAQLVGRQVSGVVLIPVDRTHTDLSPLIEADIPLVLVDRWVEGASTDLVATDNVDAGRQAAVHLHERGFRRPVVIAGPPELRTTEDRATGFLQAWRDAGVEVGEQNLLRGNLFLDSGRSAMQDILTGGEADCVYVTNNRMSAGAFEALRGRTDAPALLATDDDLWTRLVTPSVSVVSQPVRGTGRAAARMLGQRMADPDEEPSTTLLRSKIIERESTRPRVARGQPGARPYRSDRAVPVAPQHA